MSKTRWYVKPIYVMVALALVLSLGLMAGMVGASCYTDVWVDDDAAPGWYDGNHVHTIPEAIGKICPGGTVHVLPGKYDGGILVDVEDVTIESTDGPEVTIVDDPGDFGFEVIAPSVIIDGFTITGFHGGVPFDSSANDIDHSFYIDGGYGIILTGEESADNCIIRNNIVEDNSHGILIFTDYNQILHNHILYNTNYDSGIHLAGNTLGNEIHCNNIKGNCPGLINEGEGSVDATENWWGCSGGPGAVGCDAVVGDVLVTPPLPTRFEDCEECGGTPPSASVPAPAMNHWGIGTMIALLGGLLVWTVRRRQPAL